VKTLKIVINRRGCKGRLDRRTALALEKMAEAAHKDLSQKMRSDTPYQTGEKKS
jgi:hypothetical protein